MSSFSLNKSLELIYNNWYFYQQVYLSSTPREVDFTRLLSNLYSIAINASHWRMTGRRDYRGYYA